MSETGSSLPDRTAARPPRAASGDGAATDRAGGSPTPVERLEEAAADVQEAYAGDEDRPLGSYVGLLATYGAVVSGMVAFTRWRRVRLPERVSPGDLALLAVATHKLSRLVTEDPVTSPLRAPFTRYQGTSGPAELAEEVRGTGVRHAVGELLTCPFCIGQWTATSLVFGLVHAPRATRLAASVFTALTASDFLQLAYSRATAEAG